MCDTFRNQNQNVEIPNPTFSLILALTLRATTQRQHWALAALHSSDVSPQISVPDSASVSQISDHKCFRLRMQSHSAFFVLICSHRDEQMSSLKAPQKLLKVVFVKKKQKKKLFFPLNFFFANKLLFSRDSFKEVFGRASPFLRREAKIKNKNWARHYVYVILNLPWIPWLKH